METVSKVTVYSLCHCFITIEIFCDSDLKTLIV